MRAYGKSQRSCAGAGLPLDRSVDVARDGNDEAFAGVYGVFRTRERDFTDSDFKDSTDNP